MWVVRRRYARVLTEARAVHSDIAEFSQENPTEALARLSTLPNLVIVDGGKGQLSSACRELQRLGLHELPIIGLAKEFEEIHRPGRPQPLILPHDCAWPGRWISSNSFARPMIGRSCRPRR